MPSVFGSFEVLDSSVIPNLLYAMRNYFTFLAQTQLVAAGNKSTWSLPYDSVSQDVQGNTVTYPAFGSDGQLIGVAGVDVFFSGLNRTLQDSALAELRNPRQGTLLVPSNILMTCSYQKEAASVQCQNETRAGDTAICQNLDKTIQLKDITCCGTCSATKEGLSTGAKVGIGVGASIGGILLIAVIAERVRPCKRPTPPPRIDGWAGNIAPLRTGTEDPR